eukprot:461056-Pyramimonas_sp.AAC.1
MAPAHGSVPALQGLVGLYLMGGELFTRPLDLAPVARLLRGAIKRSGSECAARNEGSTVGRAHPSA